MVRKCDRLERCPFFNDAMAGMPITSRLMKKKYCLECPDSCARYMVGKSGQPVPSDLFPSNVEKAKKIIENLNEKKE